MIVKLKKETNLKDYHITNGKEYLAEVVERKFNATWYRIKCDDGHTREFLDTHFITPDEMRDKRLNDLGI